MLNKSQKETAQAISDSLDRARTSDAIKAVEMTANLICQAICKNDSAAKEFLTIALSGLK